MRYRTVILVPLFLLTTILGVALSLTGAGPESTSGVLFRNLLNAVIWAPLAEFFSLRSNSVGLLWSNLYESKGLFFFGGLGFFGLFMLGLVIRSTIKSPQDKIESSLLKALIQEKEKAENTARVKSEFLTQVSHELRTPLAVIMGYLECLIEGLYGHIDAKHKEILETVSKQSGELKNMIDQILLFSRLEAGKHQPSIEMFSIGKIIGELRETYDFLARQKGLEMTWQLAEAIPDLKSDPERLKEVLNNLLQNALKYTQRGSIYVRIQHLSATDSLALDITDTGIGIPQSALSTIFDPFVRAHKESAYNPQNGIGGIGMGLAIVKKHIEQLKGTITVESQLHQGTTFKVVLPRLFPEEQKPKPSQASGLLKLLRGRGLNGKSALPVMENLEEQISPSTSEGEKKWNIM